MSPLIASPVASNTRFGRLRPSVETIVPLSTKIEEIRTASLSSPPPLLRRSRTTPFAPLSSRSSTALRTSPCAPGCEARQSHPGDLLTIRASHLGLHRRDVDLRALELQVARLLLAGDDRERDLGARAALDQRGRLLRRLAGDRLAVDGGDHVALAQPAGLGRGVVEDGQDAQPAVDLGDVHADALERAVGRLLERLVLLRVEVGGEAVVERLDRGAEALVEQLVARDLAVVVVGDRVDRLVVGLALLVADEHVAHRPGQVARMPAQPDAEHEHDEHRRDGDQRRERSAGTHALHRRTGW